MGMGRLSVAVVVSMWIIPISVLVNRIVPDPYMDEIFHIPQVQQYCKGNFRSWDPMITTPPGLYYFSLAYVASFFPGMWFPKTISSLHELCTTPILRSVNSVLAIICSVLIYDILIHLQPANGGKRTTLSAISISLYPIHWFFSFLYYTDVASVTAILAMYLASLKQHYSASAIFGAAAVLIRQTNIVWVGFVAATSAIEYVEILYKKQLVQLDKENISVMNSDGIIKKKTPESSKIRRRWESSKCSHGSNNSGIDSGSSSDELGMTDELYAILIKFWCFKWKIMACFAPFIIVVVSFMTFVIWNGSVVLGAKEAHVVSPHFAQIMYMGLVSAAAIAPVHFSLNQAGLMVKAFSSNKMKSFLLWISALIVGFVAIHFYSIAHPYLLADNRHYTFYIWRKIINIHWMMRYLLVPVYVYSWFSIIGTLAKYQKKLWILLFFFACAAVLIPSPLIEFRYYTIPFLFLIFHSRIDKTISWLIITILYVAVNVYAMLMFLYRPFHWPHEPGVQRFIW